MKKFSEIQINSVDEGFLDKFNDSKKSIKDIPFIKSLCSKLSFFSSSSGNKKSGSKGSDGELTALEKNTQSWAERFRKQAEKEIENQLRREQEIEVELQNIANEKKLRELEAAEAIKESEHKKQLNALRLTTKKLQNKANTIKMLSTGGILDADFLRDQLDNLHGLTEDVLPAEKELLLNIDKMAKSVYYDDEGNFDADPTRVEERFKNLDPELQKAIMRDPLYKKLATPQSFEKEEDFIDFIDKNVNENPTKAVLEAEKVVLGDLERDLSNLRITADSAKKAIEANDKNLEKEREKLGKLGTSPDEKSEFKKLVGDEFVKDDKVIEGKEKQYCEARLAYIKKQMEDAASQGEDTVRTVFEKYKSELTSLTGKTDFDELISRRENGEFNVVELPLKSELTSEETKTLANNALKNTKKESETYKSEKEKVEKKIQELEEDNKKQRKILDGDGEGESIKDKQQKILDDYNKDKPEGEKINDFEELQKRKKQNAERIAKRQKLEETNKADIKRSKELSKKGAEENKAKEITKNFTDEERKEIEKESKFGLANKFKEAKAKPAGERKFELELPGDEKVTVDIERYNNDTEYKQSVDANMQKYVAFQEIGDRPEYPGDDATEEAKKEWAKDLEIYKAKKIEQESARKQLGDTLDITIDDNTDMEDIDAAFEKKNIADISDDVVDDDTDEEARGETDNEEYKITDEDDDEKQKAKAEKALKDAKDGVIHPGKIFKPRKNKKTGKKTKTRYHVKNKNYSLTEKEYKAAVARYKEKHQSSIQNSSLHITSLKNYILEQLNR